eukprot:TRINITY_DN2287_c0_g2_i1.p1 TRINITY_DN2287_c0_g2~~TRINITY_DN2287_c0_g2_i1.p1  ORF type:complete len:545 (+),score=148.04 TRINITY_DN2287_c0_g2_i1:64-1698(+)
MNSVVLVAALTVGAEICDMVPTTFRSKNETCTQLSDCLNSNIGGVRFQPWWLDNFHNINSGLTCYDGWCTARRKNGERCTSNDNCESWVCAMKPGTAHNVCYGIDTIPLGHTCPITFADIASHDRRHHLCEGNAYCSPVNLESTAANSPTVCREWAGEGDDCYVIWTEGAASAPVRHTCDPAFSDLYCQPTNATWSPSVVSPTLLKDRINAGKCMTVPEHEEPGTCATIRGTAQRAHCEYDEFCQRLNTTDAVCQEKAEENGFCHIDLDCEWGQACNSKNSLCMEIYYGTDTTTTLYDRTIFCEIGYELDIATSRCVKDSYDKDCNTDADCNPTTTAPDTVIATFYPTTWTKRHMFCNKKAGSTLNNKCRDHFAPRDGCEDEARELLKFASQSMKEGRVLQVEACADNGCFSMRGTFTKMEWYGERIMCCTLRQENSDVCLFHDGAVWSFGRTSWLGMDKSGQQGDVCPPEGLSSVTIAALIVVFGVLFLVVLFVLVKEFTYVPPPSDDDEATEEKSGKSVPSTAPNMVEEENKALGSPNEPKP